MNNKKALGMIALCVVGVLFLFQNCAKNPNLSQPSQSQEASVGTPTTAPSSGPPSSTPTTTYPVTMNQAFFVQSSSATVTAAPGTIADLGYYFSITMPIPADLSGANVTEAIVTANGSIVSSSTYPLIINTNVPVTNGVINQGLATGIALPANIAVGAYVVSIKFVDSTGAPILMNAGAGVTADPVNVGFYQVGTINVN